MSDIEREQRQQPRHGKLVLVLVALVAGMAGLAFASSGGRYFAPAR